jgi:hypothetical protein
VGDNVLTKWCEPHQRVFAVRVAIFPNLDEAALNEVIERAARALAIARRILPGHPLQKYGFTHVELVSDICDFRSCHNFLSK